MDLYKRNLDEEKRVFDAVDLTSEERRIAELKETLFKLASKLRQKQETKELYHFPDQEEEDTGGDTREQRQLKKLNQRYRDDRPRGGPPELTEEERFQLDKEKQAKSSFGVKDKRARKEEKQYELLIDNQVDFVKSDLLTGLMEKKLKKEKRKK